METWKDIHDYEGLYQGSNYGRIKSLKFGKETIMKCSKGAQGYIQVTLRKNGNRKRPYVHQLIAQTFIPNPEGKPCVDHINGNKTDNRVENLRWCTHKENNNNPLSLNKMRESHNTSEYKELMSKINKGKKRTLEQIERIRQSQIGKKLSKEHKKKISEGNKGRVVSEETRKKISESNKGHQMSEDLKMMLIEMHRGKPAPNRTPCVQLSLDDKFIAFHPSLTIEGFSNSKVSDCCKGKIKQHKGCKFMYKSDYEQKLLEDLCSQEL